MKACLLQKASTPSNLVQTNQTIGYLPQQYYDTNKQQMHMTFQHNRTVRLIWRRIIFFHSIYYFLATCCSRTVLVCTNTNNGSIYTNGKIDLFI